ncbi:MAG TPA: D-alanyl-D-alanine carboxypeptidase/D-alanyl-D-alanine-endopeptidase [Candidatus Rubrimentiphilum sp.]|nr:D-alanyl-D-alanine carboxypeptidase/D-alanyl-D-alanine-endopeptidase [Candidatus Rubrimentiphilum sp.]
MTMFRSIAACLVLALTALPAHAADMSSVASVAKPAPGGVPWKAAQIAALHRTIEKLLAGSTLRGAQVGFIAIDTVRGNALYSQNADQEFMPASNFKLLVGSTALNIFGTRFAYTTSVVSDGAPQNGAIAGNVYLQGGGDALLTAKDLDDAAAAVAAQGVTSISGSVVTDATHFDNVRYGYGWSWDDLPFYYAPVVTALELEDGVVHMYFSPGAAPGDPASIALQPATGAFTLDNRLVTGEPKSKDTSELVRPWDQPTTIRITGSYPAGAKTSGDVHPAVPDPQSYAGDVFAKALAAHGVTVAGAMQSGKAPSGATVLWNKHSEAMPQLLADFWYPSDNLMGEMFLKELGFRLKGAPGTVGNGIVLENQYLKSAGIDPATVSISDGSGLSQYDRITPRDLLLILQNDWNSPNREVVLDALPVAGVRGTLKGSYKGTIAQGNVFAKTGSISHVRTISGFVKTKTHGPVTFSFMINQWMGEDRPHGAADLATLRGAVLAAIASQ